MKIWMMNIVKSLTAPMAEPTNINDSLKRQIQELHMHPVIGQAIRNSDGFSLAYQGLKNNQCTTYAGYLMQSFNTSRNIPSTALDIMFKAGEINRYTYDRLSMRLNNNPSTNRQAHHA